MSRYTAYARYIVRKADIGIAIGLSSLPVAPTYLILYRDILHAL
jgi:hypothetical protein